MIKVNPLNNFIKINMIKSFIKKYIVSLLKHFKIVRWIHLVILLIANYYKLNKNRHNKYNKLKAQIILHSTSFQVIHLILLKATLS